MTDSESEDRTGDLLFHVRATARLQRHTAAPPLPDEVALYADGTVVVAFEGGDRLVHYDSIAECLAEHGLLETDLDPVYFPARSSSPP